MFMAASHASTQNYGPPASGLQIFDLAGTTLPTDGVVTNESASFQATSNDSTVTFVFRDDPGYFTFDNAVVADSSAPSVNLLTNGTFSTGLTSQGGGATGWTYFQQTGVTYLGQQLADPPGGWYDGSTGGYDGIYQTFATVSGDSYDVSFTLVTNLSGTNTTFQQTSTNGQTGIEGNGIDMLVYAGNGIPPTNVPEPTTGALMLGSLALLAVWRAHPVAARR
jgi:hypothetical protein